MGYGLPSEAYLTTSWPAAAPAAAGLGHLAARPANAGAGLCRIFATLWSEEDRFVVKLTPEDQAMQVEAEPDVFDPIPRSWGSRGWTNVNLFAVDEEILRGVLLASWRTVAPTELVERYAPLMLAEEPSADEEP